MRVQDRLRQSKCLGTGYNRLINHYVAFKQYVQNKSLLDQMKLYHGKYQGERCFIIGTGPSLLVSDLEKLKGEVTFASNRIFDIFSQTSWRPTYYINQDFPLIDKYQNEIRELKVDGKFLPIDKKPIFGESEDITYFVLRHKDFYPGNAEFSTKLHRYMGQGFTVTYGAIQLAAYMGFRTIYLLGIDHNYSISLDEKGIPVMNTGVKDYFEGSKADNKNLNLPRVVESTVAYMTAEKVSQKNGEFRVYNATRGGKLEAFERIEFDKLMIDMK